MTPDPEADHVSLSNSTLLVQVDDKSLTSIDPATGRKRWTLSSDALPRNADGFGDLSGEFEDGNRVLTADGMDFASFTTSKKYGAYEDPMWSGLMAVDDKTGKVRWTATHPWFSDVTKKYRGKNPLYGKEPDARGRTKFTTVTVVGAVGHTVVYTVRDRWCLCTLREGVPDINVLETTRGVDARTGKLIWEKKNFLAQEVTRNRVIGSPLTRVENLHNDYLTALDATSGKIAWQTHWKSRVEALSKDWVFIEADTKKEQDAHDGVYRADTGQRVAVFTMHNETDSGWPQEPPIAQPGGLSWAAEAGFDPDNKVRQLFSWVSDGDPHVHQVKLPPGKAMQVTYPMLIGDYALAMYEFADGALGSQQGFIDLRKGTFGEHLAAINMVINPLASTDRYMLIGGQDSPSPILYRIR